MDNLMDREIKHFGTNVLQSFKYPFINMVSIHKYDSPDDVELKFLY